MLKDLAIGALSVARSGVQAIKRIQVNSKSQVICERMNFTEESADDADDPGPLKMEHLNPNPSITEERIRVRYGETDQMGHAYYANYLYWFEQARGAWCRARGFSYKSLEEMGFFLPVVEVYARYKGEVKYDDLVVVRVWMSEIKRAAIRFDYEVVNVAIGKLVTEGYTWHVLMGSKRKAVSIPVAIREMLERDPL